MNKFLRERPWTRRCRGAFGLAELLVSAIFTSIIVACLLSALYIHIHAVRQTEDVNAALARADMVFAIIRNVTEHCGYGVPTDSPTFRARFGGLIAPFNWNGPISVTWTSTSDIMINRDDAICRIVHAVGTNVRTLAEMSTSDDVVQILASGAPPLLEAADGGLGNMKVKNWIVFGAMLPSHVPLRLSHTPTKVPGGSLLTFKWNRLNGSDEHIFIPKNDEIFYLRVLECRTIEQDGVFSFFTNDHTGSGWQRRVDGVVDARFEIAEGGRLLRVTTLTRGDMKFGAVVTRGTPQGWPEKYPPSIPEEARHYRLRVCKASFELKNF